MSLYVSQTLPTGEQIISDDSNPNVQVILKAGQFDEIARLPDSEQRHRVREFLSQNRAGPDPRSETDQNAMQTAHDAQTGEQHQEG